MLFILAVITPTFSHMSAIQYFSAHSQMGHTPYRDPAGFPLPPVSIFLFGLLLYIDFVLSNFGSLALSHSLFLSCLLLSSLQNLGLSKSICENKVPHQGIVLTHETHQKNDDTNLY